MTAVRLSAIAYSLRLARSPRRRAQDPGGGKARGKLYSFLQIFRRSKRHFFAGLDLDGLASGWVASHPGGAFSYLQNTKSRDLDPLALFEVFCDQGNEVSQQLRAFPLGQAVFLSKRSRQVSRSDRARFSVGGSFGFGWHLQSLVIG